MKIGRVLDLSSLSFEIFQTPICEIVELDNNRHDEGKYKTNTT